MIRISNFDHLVCSPDITIRETLRRINDADTNLFQIVVDDGGHVLGTVTDGDVRRAMLRGVTIDDPIRDCMHVDPVTGQVDRDAENLAKLEKLHFLPTVNSSGDLVEVLVAGRAGKPISKALVMAGGYGSRLGEQTRDLPKPLISVGDRPILDRVLTQLEDAGVDRVHLAVHYLSEKIEGYVATRANRTQIELIHEDRPLGTAGALSRLGLPVDDGILVVNGDVICQVDIAALKEFHDSHGYDGTIAVSRYDVRIPFGVLHYGDDGVFSGIDEKPTLHHFIAAGIYYLCSDIVQMVPSDRAIDMPELLEISRDAGMRIGLFPVHEYWIDIGQPEDLAEAKSDYAVTGATEPVSAEGLSSKRKRKV